MAWKCYSCGTNNPNDADVCQKCGGTVAAPKSFYVHWIFGGAVFFFIVYLAGTMAGGVLVEAYVAPSKDAILAEANLLKKDAEPEIKTLDSIKPDERAAAKASAVAKAKEKTSAVIQGVLFWIFPAILFILCGAMVGFISDGKTIIEAGIASVAGQVGGFALHAYLLDTGFQWMVLAIGVVPGFALGFLGAWLGEIMQDRKERAGGITG